jgi:signal peptidase I
MLAVVAAIIMFILVAPVRVHGDNMSPALNDGDVVIILKSSYYDARPPKYGDVLCFKRSFEPEGEWGSGESAKISYRFARVIGLPGDEIRIGEGSIFRNGDRLNLPELAVPSNASSHGPQESSAYSREVGTGDVFVLNDDTTDAMDSRDDRVDARLDGARGKAVFRVWPLDRFGKVS